jgi:hypothetical protein
MRQNIKPESRRYSFMSIIPFLGETFDNRFANTPATRQITGLYVRLNSWVWIVPTGFDVKRFTGLFYMCRPFGFPAPGMQPDSLRDSEIDVPSLGNLSGSLVRLI